MRARRVLLLAFLLIVAAVGLWAQPGPFTIIPTSLPVGGGTFVVGQTIPLQQLGPNPQLDQAFAWAVSGGNLPPGLNLDQVAGTITGIPTVAGAYTFTILAQEIGTNFVAFQQYTLYISLGTLSLAPLSPPQAAVGAPYTGSPFRAVAGVPGYTWSLQNGPSVDGLSINSSSGQLSGTPVVGGTLIIAVVLTDASGAQASANFNLNVLGISARPLPGGTVGTAYSQTLAAAGSTGTLSWSLTGSNLAPPGLTLSSQGQITGTPTANGTFPFVVQVTDSATGLSAVQALSITVAAPTTIGPATLPNGVVNVPYTATTLTVQGVTISNWAVTVGTLPAGLNLNAVTGVISGTPTAAGNSTFTISATPASLVAALPPVVQAFTIVGSAAPTVTITGLPTVGVAATQSTAAVTLNGTYPLNITGNLTLTFSPTPGVSQIYDEKFGTGNGTVAPFTIPANSTQGLFGTATSVPLIVGTVAGTITVTATATDSAGNALATPTLPPITVTPTAPVITKSSFNTAGGAFSISVTGYSPTRDMSTVLFHFTPTTSGPLTTTDFTLPLTAPFTTWYNSSTSTAFGSQFTMTVPFTFTGPPGTTFPCIGVAVTLTNSKGASTPSSITCQAVIPVP